MATVRKLLDKTQIDIDASSRRKVCGILQQALADSTDLVCQAKTAHWNVKGPHFIALHKLFDEFYEEMAEHVDTIAERIGSLGGTIMGRVQDSAKSTRIPGYPMEISEDMGHVKALSKAYGKFANEIRADIDKCEDLEDKVTADILNAITAAVDKNIWFMEAHLR